MPSNKHTDFTWTEHKYVVVKVQLYDGHSACIRTDRVSALYERKDEKTGDLFTVIVLDNAVDFWVQGSLDIIVKMLWDIE